MDCFVVRQGSYRAIHPHYIKIMNNNQKGIACMISSAFFFALMSFFVRYAAGVPFTEKVFFRNAIAAVVALPLFLRTKHNYKLVMTKLPDLFCRVTFGTIGMFCNYYAIDHMNLSDANMLNKTSPFFTMLAAIFLLKEKPTKVDWAALMIAFVGALLIMKPSLDVHFAYAVIGVMGGFSAGMAYTFVRRLSGAGIDNTLIVLAFSLYSCIICAVPSAIQGIDITMHEFVILMLVGISAACAQFSVTAAYSYAETRVVSIYGYTQIIFAALLGVVFLHETPDMLSILGYVVIIGAAVIRSFCKAG